MKKHQSPSEGEFLSYIKMLDDETQQNKRKNKKIINEVGDSLANEMSLRSEKENEKRKIIINEIEKYNHGYDIDDLLYSDLRELFRILKMLEYQNRGFFRKLYDLLTQK